jgi:hypothetical protein
LTTRPIERVAHPEFLKLKFKHFIVKLDNVRELGNVLDVFPDGIASLTTSGFIPTGILKVMTE